MKRKEKNLTCIDESGAKEEFYALSKEGWTEVRRTMGEKEGEPYIIPESGVISIRFSPMEAGLQIRVYKEKQKK